MHKAFSNYLSFSKKEGVAALVLVIIIVPFVILPFLTKPADNESNTHNGEWVSITQVLDEKAPVTYEHPNYPRKTSYRFYNHVTNKSAATARLFSFDPNTASAEELGQLGLRDKTIQILSNYRNKGGKFRKADDLQKIYGLRPDEFERLKPFIVIAHRENAQLRFENQPENKYATTAPNKDHYKRKVVVIDVNAADTTAFQSLYGIGSKLAARIVNFRNKLGGFYSIEQVGETYGVPDSTFQKIKPFLKLNEADLSKMNINTASYEQLNAHPYISAKLAFQIMKYRKDNGSFNNLEILKELVSQTNDSYEKVVNYVTL
ncbi:MAG: hypothetical protein BGN92_08085 [Sphingobacteriales bacterium 41-5]|nr:MAG: hypothetical protein BGN92_08085 [Sphingobacteriales bacterium 41-5]